LPASEGKNIPLDLGPIRSVIRVSHAGIRACGEYPFCAANLGTTLIAAGLPDVPCESLLMPTNTATVYSIELERISEALISSGHTSLDQQAKALGVHRNTAWTIVKNKHKLGRLSAKTIERILRNPQTPPRVRVLVEQYLVQRSLAADRQAKQKLGS